MIVDAHVHVACTAPGKGIISSRVRQGISFRYMQWAMKLIDDPTLDQQIESKLAATIEQCAELDAAVILAFDAVHTRDGVADWARTHLYTSNDYVIELVKRHPKMLFAASVHPYRKDAIAELERCVAAGAVLMKWLPIVQDFNPADERCIPFYEALAHHKLPLLSHTGWEHALPNLDRTVADPMLLQEALRRGVTVIAAHCGSRLMPWEIDFVPSWVRMAHEYENFYGDTAALNVPNRWYAFDAILKDEVVRSKLVHGSDWPILAVPPPLRLGWDTAWKMMADPNWMRRDIAIKRKLGFDDTYFQRAATLLKMAMPAPPVV